MQVGTHFAHFTQLVADFCIMGIFGCEVGVVVVKTIFCEFVRLIMFPRVWVF